MRDESYRLLKLIDWTVVRLGIALLKQSSFDFKLNFASVKLKFSLFQLTFFVRNV